MKCDQCEMVSIQGVPCHEHGCPNSNKQWYAGRWVVCEECAWCGCTEDDGCCCAEECDE